MDTAQKQFIGKTAIRALIIASVLAASAFSQGTSQGLDTAKVPVVVNVDATVSIQPPAGGTGSGASRALTAGKTDTLIVRIAKGTSVSHNPRARASGAALVAGSGGRLSLNLPAQSYKNAEISLFTVNGKRVMHEKMAASGTASLISRPNIAAGAYLLSAKGLDGGAATFRHTHGGGSLNISVAFAGEAASNANALRKEAESLADGWTITAKPTAAGYLEEAGALSPKKGVNELRTISFPVTAQVGCNRSGLVAAVDAYLAAIAAGNYNLMPLAENAKYYEDDHDAKQDYRTGKFDKAVAFGEGLWKTPLVVDFHRNLIDLDSCASFTEIIISSSAKQYLNGAKLKVTGDKISEVNVIVTQSGDWAFNAANYLRYSKGEDWSQPPVTGRREREQLRSDAYAYFAYFNDDKAPAPWATPCARLEGGAYTGDGGCDVGLPPGVNITPIAHLADVDYGMVVVFIYFGGPDSHWFRILPTGYRYIHTLTAMKQSDYKAP